MKAEFNEEYDVFVGVEKGDTDYILKALIANPASLNKQDEYGLTPIHRAAYYGNFSLVHFFVAQSALDLSLKDNQGREPIDMAILSGNQKCIDAIFAKSFNIESEIYELPTQQEKQVDKEENPFRQNPFRNELA
ncbi:MAG: ankyrin repeat domain-containing protein [Pseudomonadota bacterium]